MEGSCELAPILLLTGITGGPDRDTAERKKRKIFLIQILVRNLVWVFYFKFFFLAGPLAQKPQGAGISPALGQRYQRHIRTCFFYVHSQCNLVQNFDMHNQSILCNLKFGGDLLYPEVTCYCGLIFIVLHSNPNYQTTKFIPFKNRMFCKVS